MCKNLIRLSRTVVDLLALSAALWLAFAIRFDWDIPSQMLKRLIFTWPWVVGLQFAFLAAAGVTKFAWRYVSLRDINRIALSIAAATVFLLAARILSSLLLDNFAHARYAGVPLGVIVANFVLAFLGVSGVRIVRRLVMERVETKKRVQSVERVRTLLVGAGSAGVTIAREIQQRPDLGIDPVGFVDDDPAKIGAVIHGLPVLGTTYEMSRLAEKHQVDQTLITIATANRAGLRRIAILCKESGLETKIIPRLYEIVGGQVSLTRIRPVEIDDLLGRDPVVLDEEAISGVVRGRVVLVTGAGGSIGSELCRQVCRYGPRRLLLVERAENNLFEIHRELREAYNQIPVHPCVGDICDRPRLAAIFSSSAPGVVFHAAAHKHVPMMEWNPGEAVKNNIQGTCTVAELAAATGTREFVMVSTDKAINPTSVMGATKRAAEMFIQAMSQRCETTFVTVRFGNVLGSAGSVLPIFERQIERGGPITVTHPEMRRYFMTISEACQLVLQAASMGTGGEIFILDMGEPMKIVDLARDMIRLSGLQPDEDIRIEFCGLRPGEKLFEELSVSEENADKTRHAKIFVGRLAPRAWDDVLPRIDALCALANSTDADAIRRKLGDMVPEFRFGGAKAGCEHGATSISAGETGGPDLPH